MFSSMNDFKNEADKPTKADSYIYEPREECDIVPPDAKERPRLWRLALMIDSEALSAVIYSTVEDSSLRHIRIALDQSATNKEKALEDAVYSHPFLLSDFGRVDCVVCTERFTLLPSEIASDTDTIEAACRLAGLTAADSPDEECNAALHADTPSVAGACVTWAIDENIDRFIARTFRNPSLRHHLTPMLQYFGAKTAAGNTSKAYVHLSKGSRQNRADIMLFRSDGRPASVSSLTFDNMEDVTYHVLAAARDAGMDTAGDQFMLCGDSTLRENLTQSLRRFATYVMPVIFPSALFRAGRDAVDAPFPLVILPFCE